MGPRGQGRGDAVEAEDAVRRGAAPADDGAGALHDQRRSPVTAHDALVQQGAMSQLLLWFSLAEVISSVAVIQMLNGSGRKPGDFALDPLGFLKDKPEAEVAEMELRELKNGRLAMLAFSGVVTQAVLTQGPFPYV